MLSKISYAQKNTFKPSWSHSCVVSKKLNLIKEESRMAYCQGMWVGEMGDVD